MALVNAYVHTPLAVALFKAEDQLLDDHGYRRPVYIAHVNGGVARVAKTKAVDTAESSPFFGLSACAWWARQVRARPRARSGCRRHDGQARRDRRRASR